MAASLIGTLPNLTPEQLQEDNGGKVLGCAIAFIVIDIGFVGMRYFTRYKVKTPFGWDDLLVFPALLFSIAICCLMIAMVEKGGLGRHFESLELPAILFYAKMSIIFGFLYLFAVTLPKLAIICFYLRIFVDQKHRIACYVIFATSVLYAVISLLVTSFTCIPLDAFWNLSITNPRCIDVIQWWRWSTLPSAIYDFLLLLMPIPMVLKLKLPARERAGIMCIFFAGGIGLVASIVRIVTFFQTDGLGDLTWTGVKLGIAGIVETGTYLVAVSIPSMRPLYMYYTKKGKSGTGATTGDSSYLMTKRFKHLDSGRDVGSTEAVVKDPSISSQRQFV